MSRNQKASAKRVSRQDRLARAQLKRRIASIRAAADEQDEKEEVGETGPDTEENGDVEEKEARALKRKARRIRRACLKKAQEMLDEEPAVEDADDSEIAEIAEEVAEEAAEDIIEQVDPDAPFEEIVDEIEEAVEDVIEEVVEARKRKANRAKSRSAAKKRAFEESDDLTGPEGDSANIEQLHDGDGISVDTEESDEKSDEVAQEPPASVNEAEDKVAAAYELIEAQIAQNIVLPGVEKSRMASKYVKKYSSREMRFATQQLRAVGSAGRSATVGVRIQNRGAMPQMKSAALGGDIADELAFA